MNPGAVEVLETDVLVIGAGAGGLWAALSAKSYSGEGVRVSIVDTRVVGRTGHVLFTSHAQTTVFPDQDLDLCVRDIIEGNAWIADQVLVRDVLEESFLRLRDLERMGAVFPKENGQYVRHRTRGLRYCTYATPLGGGVAACWAVRQQLVKEGVQVLDQLFVTDLLTDADGRAGGALAMHSRNGTFHLIKAKAIIVATNAPTFRTGFGRDLTGTGTIMAYEAGATLANAEFNYLRPSFANFYFEGITPAAYDGARYVNALGEYFMDRYDPEFSDRADALVICQAMLREKLEGRAPLYLDFSLIRPERRSHYFDRGPWMKKFRVKLQQRLGVEFLSKQECYPLPQMTKMSIKTDSQCRSEVPGLFAAGLAQTGCATHFASWHIGMSVGTGWIAGRSAARYASQVSQTAIAEGEARQRAKAHLGRFDASQKTAPDIPALRQLQKTMFHYEVSILKKEGALRQALGQLDELEEECRRLTASDVHDFVRIKETEAMVPTARFILEASLLRTESRLSHIREEYPERDDAHWIKWVVIKRQEGKPHLSTQEIPTPLCPPPRQVTARA